MNSQTAYPAASIKSGRPLRVTHASKEVLALLALPKYKHVLTETLCAQVWDHFRIFVADRTAAIVTLATGHMGGARWHRGHGWHKSLPGHHGVPALR